MVVADPLQIHSHYFLGVLIYTEPLTEWPKSIYKRNGTHTR